MRKTVSILFLLAIVGSQSGYYLFNVLQQYQLKEQVKKQLVENITDSSLQLIVANQHYSFRWEEEGKEFYQDGQLYDVVKSVTKDGNTILYCINDKKEEELLSRLEKETKSANGNAALQILKIPLTDNYFQQIEPTIYNRPVFEQHYFYFDAAITALYKEVYAPPPRFYSPIYCC